MARIRIPDSLDLQRRLVKDIRTRHIADGASSPLTAFLTAQDIKMGEMMTAHDNVVGYDISRAEKFREGERERRLRNEKFDPVFRRFKGMAQFLKSFYRGTEHTLGDWGITVNDNQLVYPAPFSSRADLCLYFYNHYTTVGAGSPLTTYITQHSIDLTNEAAIVNESITHHIAMDAAFGLSEMATQQRDNLWRPVMANVRAIGAYLKKLHKNNEQQLTLWGFEVDDSPRPSGIRISTLIYDEQRIINGAKVGGELINLGTGDLHFWKGDDILGTPTIIPAGQRMALLKGMSVFTIKNPSLDVHGKFSFTSTKKTND